MILHFCSRNSNVSLEQEMQQRVMNWAANSKNTVNLLKPVELVFRTPSISHDTLDPPPVTKHVR